MFFQTGPLLANGPASRLNLLRIYCWTVTAINSGTDGRFGIVPDDFTFMHITKVARDFAMQLARK
jgi:hypothetical protein